MKPRASGWMFAAPYLTLFTAFVIGPLLFGFALSLFRWELLSNVKPTFVGFENYAEAFRDPYVHQALGATLRFVWMAVPATILLALVIATGLNAVAGKRQGFWRAAIYVPHLLTVSVAGILWRWFYNKEFGILNAMLRPIGIEIPWLSDVAWAMPAIVLMTLWWTLGGPSVVLLSGLQNIPVSYLEAASLDGATPVQRYFRIILPLMRPVLLFVTVMHVIGGFQVFGQVYMITRGGPELSTRSLVQYIYETAFNNYRMGYAAALSWILFAVIALFTLVQFRLMREERS